MNQHRLLFISIFIIVILAVWKYYWRIQLMYNSSLLSLYTPDSFYIEPEKEERLEQMTQYGFKQARNKTMVICTMLRDARKNMKQIITRAEKLGGMFKDYRILVVENDSKDGTREALIEWKERNPKVVVLGCGINSSEACSIKSATVKTEGHSVNRQRIEKMTKLRNIYLDFVKRNLSHFDFMAVWDLDIIGSVYIDGVANTIGQFTHPSGVPDASAICAYGIYRWSLMEIYYDTYAHLDDGDDFHINEKGIHDLKKGLGVKYRRGNPPQQVKSCFSGFTIYKISSIRPDVEYDMSPPGNVECEHVRLHRQLEKIYLNPSMIHLVLFNE